MVLKLRGLVLGVATACAAGCGSSSPATPQTYPDAQALDGAGKEVSVDAGTADGSTKPPPMSGEGNVVPPKGPAQMLANRSSCTNEVGATGDRWCAFLARSNTSLDGMNLFVINVSRAAAGVTITCESSMGDPNCLKLTGGFFEEAEAPFRHAAGFQ